MSIEERLARLEAVVCENQKKVNLLLRLFIGGVVVVVFTQVVTSAIFP